MRTTVPKWLWIASSTLIILALIPSLALRLLLWSFLAIPFRWLYSPPLVYADKPWYLTYLGGVITAIAWSICLAVVAMLFSSANAKGEKQIKKRAVWLAAAVLLLLVLFFLLGPDGNGYVAGRTLYYTGFVGKGLPFAPTGEIDEKRAKSANVYLIGHYDAQGRLVVLEKYLNGAILFRHDYRYNKWGRCVSAHIKDGNGERNEDLR